MNRHHPSTLAGLLIFGAVPPVAAEHPSPAGVGKAGGNQLLPNRPARYVSRVDPVALLKNATETIPDAPNSG